MSKGYITSSVQGIHTIICKGEEFILSFFSTVKWCPCSTNGKQTDNKRYRDANIQSPPLIREKSYYFPVHLRLSCL